MPTSPTAQYTDFSKDVLGRYVCNGLDEALHSTSGRADARAFDIVVVGGGSFGGALAQHLLYVQAQIVGIQILAPKVAGIHEIEHRGEDLDDALARGQIAMRDAPPALIAQVTAEQLFREFLECGGLRRRSR